MITILKDPKTPSNNLNIIFSDDNNRGKTIVLQGIMYALGNNPIFPESFNFPFAFFS